jgi:hypothetical protein
MSERLAITGCSDPLLWYAPLIGQLVDLVRDLPAEGTWLSREPAGYLNIVYHCDAVPVPRGYKTASADTVLQHLDLIFADGLWRNPRLDQLGTSVAGHIVIRLDKP